MTKLLDYILENYYTHDEIKRYIEKYIKRGHTFENFNDFLHCMIWIEEDNFPYSLDFMNVTASTTWGICQEYLGNLDERDRIIIADRSGCWSYPMGGKYTSFREICQDIQTKFA